MWKGLSMSPWRNKFFSAIVLVVLLWGCGAADYSSIKVIYVYDGDTIKLADGEKVRLIGIDCPEEWESDKLFRDAKRSHQRVEDIKKQGEAAAQFTRSLVLGKKVRLEFDEERRDQYGRLLAYVYEIEPLADEQKKILEGDAVMTGSDIFVNATLLKSGWARSYKFPPNTRFADWFQQLNQEAKEQRRGLWQN